MSEKIVELPSDFIGPEDEERLESFGAYLISHGRATHWHWNREHGVDTAFEIYRGGPQEALLCSIRRDRAADLFYAVDASGERLAQGKLDRVMAVVDERAVSIHGDPPA